ncbi:hypothetical protein [uncultured Eubacterium sp.]|uniref:hypothetical protein n=1 Tax=uncultured Eubacterium sp. TaxID=165185 RepID=UPI0015BC4531|nr:hypothetical protein [uncultured Eubacterium sp.]
MVKRLFKKSIAIILAVLMVVTTLPLSALAAESSFETVERTLTIEQKNTGLITNGANVNQRINGSRYEVCNDNGNDNFTVAYWQYDTQAVKDLGGVELKNASFTLTIPTAPLNNATGLSVYYVDNTNADSFTGGDTRYASLYGGNGETNRTNAINTFGLVKIQDIATSSLTAGAKINIDIAQAFNNAISSAKNYSRVTIMVMQTGVSTNSSGSNWSDTYVDYSTAIKVTAAYDETIEVFPGLEGINAGISTFESKMASSSTNNIYKNMLPAYQAYLKAIRYRDAYQYGGQNAPTTDELDAVAQALQTANANMEVWTDEVTGKFTGVTPSFNDCGTSRNVTQGTDFKYYNNIIYTEDCRTSNSGKEDAYNGSDWSGMAIGYPLAGDVYMEIYYPNTILLWDGTESIMPVMFMAKKQKNENRYITNVYPAQQLDASDTSWQTTKVGNDTYFVCTSVINGSKDQTWRGSADTRSLNFDNSRQNGTSGVGAAIENTAKQYSADLKTDLSWGRQYYWNAYAASFQLRELDTYFAGASQKGYKTVGNYWAWYGVSKVDSDTYFTSDFVDVNMKGYSQSVENSKHGVKKIYAFNYKGIADAIKNPDKAKLLADVKNYQQGGLLDLIAAYDAATSWANTANVSAINLDNIATQATNITNMMNAINKGTATIDTGYASYKELKKAIDDSKKYYAIDNTDYTKYTQEVWDPFVTAYQNAANYFYALYDSNPNDISIKSDLVFANAEPFIEPLNTARDNLKNGMIRSVVNTQTLEYAIDNATDLVNNPQYFVDGTVDTGLADLVSQIKIAIWTSEDSYGYDTEKIDLTTENQALVDGYVEQLCTKIAAAQFNVNYVLPNNYSMTTAIAKAQTYEKDAEKYGNYNTLQNAVADANTFQTQLGTFNGRIENQVGNTISSYADLVTKIVAAFTGLQPAFKLISNGTFASQGKTVKSEYSSATRPNNFKFYWEYSTDQIIFITNHEAFSYELPISRWGSYNKQTGTDFETVFDSIILDASNLTNGEITLSGAWNAGHGWLSGNGMTATQLEEYKAKTRISAGLELLIDSVKVTNSTGKAVGVDSSGADITDINHDFITELAVTDGHDTQGWGGIYAKNGWTEFTTRTLVNVPAQTGAADMDNIPSKISNQLLLGKANASFGHVYFWRYAETAIDGWAGYGFERTPLLLNVQFVNVSTLFDLIAECSADSFVATKSQYTTTSWNALQNAITDANSNMDYANMTYDAIITECDRRYNNLYNARRTLKKCASNAALKKALSDYKTIYDNDQSKVKADSWTTFATAYENAAAKFNSDYSDLNITDVAASDQSKIDAFVTALTDAKNALIYKIDFQPLTDALNNLLNIEDNVYTAESARAVDTAIRTNCTYIKLTDSQKDKLYQDDDVAVAGVQAEIEKLNSYRDLLVSYESLGLDDSSLQAEKEKLKASKDPDAYDPDQIATALATIAETETVDVYGKNVLCKKFASQPDMDTAITKALSTVGLKQYTLTVKSDNNDSTGYVVNGTPVDVNGSVTFDYGTQINIARADGSSVDWYYEYTSTNTSLAKKLYSTTDELQFVLRGNTILTTKSGTSTNNLKVSYVNSVNGSNVAVDYVPSGTQITLDASKAPKLPYYTFDSFKVNGVTKASGDVITVTENTRITYVYTFTDENSYKVYVADLAYAYAPGNFTIENLKYNDEVSFVPGTPGASDGYGGNDLCYTVKHYVNEEGKDVERQESIPGNGRLQTGYGEDYSAPPVYAWVKVNADDLDAWYQSITDETRQGGLILQFGSDGVTRYFTSEGIETTKGEVVMYGPEYTFRVHEDVALLPLDEETFNTAVAAGVIVDKGNTDGAAIFTKSQLVVAPNQKVSIISNYALPEGCTMVEKGVLASVSTTGEITAGKDDFKLGNVGTNGINKLKSNYTTAGNQFVISINTPTVAGRVIDTNVWFKWVAYLTYKDANGNLNTVYTPVTTPSNVTDGVNATL